MYPLTRMLLVAVLLHSRCLAEVTIDLTSAVIRLDNRGHVISLQPSGAAAWTAKGPAAFRLDTPTGSLSAVSVQRDGDQLFVNFERGARAVFKILTQPGFALFDLISLQCPQPVERFRLFALPLPSDAERMGILNAAQRDGWVAAVIGTEMNVLQPRNRTDYVRGGRPGCTHQFLPDPTARVGRQAARFVATCDNQTGGWSLQGKMLSPPLNLSGLRALRLWVFGDGQNELLKVQLADGVGGYRDDYLTIDFNGWRQVVFDRPALNTLRDDHVTAVHFYFNGMPAGKTVSCRLDQLEALIGEPNAPRELLLEDFESVTSPLWASELRTLEVQTIVTHGITPARFALVICPAVDFFARMPVVEQAAGLPSPRLGGVWNKQSPWVKQSYLFLTDFRESDFEAALDLARAGGFKMVLLAQQSWCDSAGHYRVHRQHFPAGLPGLVRTVQRFQDAGIKVGLHFLAASIGKSDAYLTPLPDPRLVTRAQATLSEPIDDACEFIPTTSAPFEFPAEDGGYLGQGTVLRVGDELVAYADRSLKAPFGFRGCRRGYLGTRVASHAAGESVLHLVRAYGDHLIDLDSSLFDEVTTRLARVANACGVDMLYLDGADRLQGDADYYNARLIRGFYDKLQRKDVLIQASGFGPYAWHLVARHASADGHGDLKGYLEERSPEFHSLKRQAMPLDIGWYYGYDPSCTPDMYEYILGATIGYHGSFSYQVSPAAAARNPFTSEILSLVSRYEKLRLSDRVPPAVRNALRIDPVLAGKQTPEARASHLGQRREYRLVSAGDQQIFQRVVYSPWHDIELGNKASTTWRVDVPEGPATIGLQVHVPVEPWLAAGPSYDAPDAITLETFDDLSPYARVGSNQHVVRRIGPGEAGIVSPGVTQQLELADTSGRAGPHYAVFTAHSERHEADGWCAISKTFDPPVDLSAHRGIGLWILGDGKGGLLKVQLGDGRKAADYLVTNDFVGWRYQQFARPQPDPIDYSHVRTLTFYYNGLPDSGTVSCGLDDVRALTGLDVATLANPAVEISGQQLGWRGELASGEYIFLWPGELPQRFGVGVRRAEGAERHSPVPSHALPAGEYTARFTSGMSAPLRLRVRLTLQLSRPWDTLPACP